MHSFRYLNKKIITFISILTFVYPQLEVNSHDKLELHDLCLGGKDYSGCIKKNTNSLYGMSYLRSYGTLKLNWKTWRSRGDNHITKAVNSNGQILYVAINCKKRMLNTTRENNQWNNWFFPKERFEFNLISDYCEM